MTQSTTLVDRTLRHDGVSVISPDTLVDSLLKGVSPSMLRVTEINADVEMFNNRADDGDVLRLDGDEVSISHRWSLPANYLHIDLEAYIVDHAASFLETSSYTLTQQDAAYSRIQDELLEIQQRGMSEFFKTIIYILDTFRAKGIIWGVGRGSSCACYILYILGLHSVDCVLYDVPHTEFFHD